MSMHDRAAQFAPFAALTGYEAAVGETARLTSERRELDPQEAEELNRRLTDLAARLKDRPKVTVEYFVPDERKSGGAYVTMTGVVRHISIAERVLVMEDERWKILTPLYFERHSSTCRGFVSSPEKNELWIRITQPVTTGGILRLILICPVMKKRTGNGKRTPRKMAEKGRCSVSQLTNCDTSITKK